MIDFGIKRLSSSKGLYMLQMLKRYGNKFVMIKTARMMFRLAFLGASALAFFSAAPAPASATAIPAHRDEQAPKIKAEIVKTPVLDKEKNTPVVLRLTYAEGGYPVMEDDLKTTHTRKIHVLTIDPQLQDYAHGHPAATIETPGEYAFLLKPHTDCTYRAWVDLTPANGPQQYAVTDIPGKRDCGASPINKFVNTAVDNGGYRFALSMDGPLAKGKMAMLKIAVADKDGQPVEELEPIMGAYAHLVGFYDDYKTLAHLHPTGEEPASQDDRGGPELTFHFMPERRGYMRLFAQFVINGQGIAAPFGVIIGE